MGVDVERHRGARVSNALSGRYGIRPAPYDQERYRRTERFSAAALKNDPRGAARKLVLPLTRATTRGSYDPFAE